MRKGIKGADLSVEMDLSPEHELYLQHLAQRQRGQTRLKMSAGQVDEMVRQFIDSHGGTTACPPAYACKSRQYHLR
jgi:hypothetical protein